MSGHAIGTRWPALAALAAFARRARSAERASPRLDGGLALARDKPGLERPIIDVPLPPVLILPLVGHRGRSLVPEVRPGQRVVRGEPLAHGLPSGADGVVVAIEPRPIAHPAGRDVPCVVVRTEASGRTIRSPLPTLDALTAERLTRCGVGGLGGAGFPTADKLADAATGNRVHTLVVNAAECEPGIACDEALIPTRADEIVAGALALAHLAGARRCLVVIESDKRAARAALERAIDAQAPLAIEAGDAGAIEAVDAAGAADTTASPDGIALRLLDVAPVYPSGAERLLLRLATGTDVPAGERPSRHGLLCVNVATALAAHRARLGEPSLERIVTVAGARAAQPCNARVTFGTPIGDVLDATGQGTRALDTRRRIGGPLSGFDVANERVPVTATTNRIALEPPLAPRAAEPCIRCAACSDVCPVGLLPQELLRHARSGDERALDRGGLDACLECGCCDLVCPSSIELTATFRHARGTRLDAHLREREAALAEQRFHRRESRLARREAAPTIGHGQAAHATISRHSGEPDGTDGAGEAKGADGTAAGGRAAMRDATTARSARPGAGADADVTTVPMHAPPPGSTSGSAADPTADPVAAALARARQRRQRRNTDRSGDGSTADGSREP